MGNIFEDKIDPYINFSAWLNKRIKANRFHFLKNMNIENWPNNKFIEYKSVLYQPLRIDWPEGRDYGVIFVKPVGTVRKLQSGPSTDVVPIDANRIKIQISHEIKKSKKNK